MLAPQMIPPSDWGEAGGGMGMNGMEGTAAWRERERRQRSIRLLMMFLLMLLLMDNEEQNGRKRMNNDHTNGRRKNKNGHGNNYLSPLVYQRRQKQEETIYEITKEHIRYKQLVKKNSNKDIVEQVYQYAENKAILQKDEFGSLMMGEDDHNPSNPNGAKTNHGENRNKDINEENDPETSTEKVFHFPWNATGFYRGEWFRKESNDTMTMSNSEKSQEKEAVLSPNSNSSLIDYVDGKNLEKTMITLLKNRNSRNTKKNKNQEEKIGVFLLPQGKHIIMRDDNNLTSTHWDLLQQDSSSSSSSSSSSGSQQSGAILLPPNNLRTGGDYYSLTPGASSTTGSTHFDQLFKKASGRAAFQLFTRTIPSMKEISLIDGFIKLYDSNMPGYSSRKDILMRVRGVLIHNIGRLSLVANSEPGRSVLFIASDIDKASDDDNQKSDNKNKIKGENKSKRSKSKASAIPPSTTKTKALIDDEQEVEDNHMRHRRLKENLKMDSSSQHENIEQIRDDVLAIFPPVDVTRYINSQQQPSNEGRREDDDVGIDSFITHLSEEDALLEPFMEEEQEKREQTKAKATSSTVRRRTAEQQNTIDNNNDNQQPEKFYTWSDIVIPYPYVQDDEDETIRKTKTPAARRMPPKEQLLERNAGNCEFEIDLDVQEVEWTLGEWNKLVSRRVNEATLLNPIYHDEENDIDEFKAEENNSKKNDSHNNHKGASTSSRGISSSSSSRNGNKKGTIQDQALAMTLIGSIESPNCEFSASLNVTALRTDWEHTTGKAINYSFYMMLTCLAQIMVLLRQLLHTQAQSAATRVSLLCIGWQTVLDALLCLGHIYLSLAMQPLFTAFASVAFFKLLIFCVIEMKYMALIIQARNNSNGGNTAELLRRQVAMLHLRFYVALFGSFLAFFYAGDKYRIIYILVLYSFWVPQIVQNVITEAKRPLHHYYIYGMSISRLIAPLYIFAVPNNFLKEVYPESPTDIYMCELLILWIAIQTGVLIAQGKYGARFMIPARFLPPKFDYSRPIPPSLLLSQGTVNGTIAIIPDSKTNSGSGSNHDGGDSIDSSPSSTAATVVDNNTHPSPPEITSELDRHTTSVTTRNRKQKRTKNNEISTSSSTTSTIHNRHNRIKADNNDILSGSASIPSRDDNSNHPQQSSLSGTSSGASSGATVSALPDITLDCVICYNSIDVHNRRGYMLAPCDHIFHRDCLIQWMDIKMECPVCRTELPSI